MKKNQFLKYLNICSFVNLIEFDTFNTSNTHWLLYRKKLIYIYFVNQLKLY